MGVMKKDRSIKICRIIKSLFSSLRLNFFFFLMIRQRPISTRKGWSAASDVYKRQVSAHGEPWETCLCNQSFLLCEVVWDLSLIHIPEPTRRYAHSYVGFCLNKKTVYNYFTMCNCSYRLA